MSRGAGIIQRAIIDAVTDSKVPVAVESLRWELFESSYELQGGVPEDVDHEMMSMSWYTSFDRALKTLVQKRMAIRIASRPLNGLDEFLAHFPDKTRSRVIRHLRRTLLPGLIQWVSDEGLRQGYDSLGNEAFHLRSATLAEARKRWSTISPKLMGLVGRLPPEKASALFRLIGKAKEILEDPTIRVQLTFARALAECEEKCDLSVDLKDKLRELSESILPGDRAGLLRIKSYVHAIADVGRHRGCRLKRDTLNHLDKHFHDIVSGLPGYSAPPSDVPRRLKFMHDQPEAKHSPLLSDSLIHQSAFRPFRFIAIA